MSILKQQQYVFDWYSLYKINPQSPNFEKFRHILSASITTHQLSSVPLSHRKNLLTLFQCIDTHLNQQGNALQVNQQSLLQHKRAISQQTNQLQQQLQFSLTEIKVLKQGITQKRKILSRLKAKKQKHQEIQRIVRQGSEPKYYCPFCERQQFNSKEVFKFHVFSHNSEMAFQNSKGSGNEAMLGEMKEFMLTMKDKQMQIMKIILKDKRDNDMRQMERMYERQMEKFYQVKKNSRNQSISIDKKDEDNGELVGQSQYYFFSGSGQKAISIGRKQQDYGRQLNRLNVQPGKTYMVGNTNNDIKYPQSQEEKYFNCPSLKEPITQYVQTRHQPSNYKTHNYFERNNQLSEYLYRNTANKGHHQTIQYPKNQQQSNFQSNQKVEIVQQHFKVNRQASHRQPLNNSMYYEDKFNSINNQSQLSISQKEKHIFNAGILIDDSDSQSEYQDYFSPTDLNLNLEQGSQIEDQEIIVDAQIMVRDISTLRKNKDPIFNSEQRIQIKYLSQNDKSDSCIVDLSEDSIRQSARKPNPQRQYLPHFQSNLNDVSFKSLKNESSHQYSISMTSNQEQVNLSDLRISKLPVKNVQKNIQESHRQSIRKTEQINQQQSALDRVKNFNKKKAQNSYSETFNASIVTYKQKSLAVQGVTQQRKINNLSKISQQRKQNFRQQNVNKQKVVSDSILSEFFKFSNQRQKVYVLDQQAQHVTEVGQSESRISNISTRKQDMQQSKSALDQFMIKR